MKRALLFVVLLVSACAAPPVQEMSDARQAIRAARAAGAAHRAPDALQNAEQLLATAEQELRSGDYRGARRAATTARARAGEALAASRVTVNN